MNKTISSTIATIVMGLCLVLPTHSQTKAYASRDRRAEELSVPELSNKARSVATKVSLPAWVDADVTYLYSKTKSEASIESRSGVLIRLKSTDGTLIYVYNGKRIGDRRAWDGHTRARRFATESQEHAFLDDIVNKLMPGRTWKEMKYFHKEDNPSGPDGLDNCGSIGIVCVTANKEIIHITCDIADGQVLNAYTRQK